ncbi:MAG: hypothetical protein MR031_03260 [Tenericutes bacterium]|nr:hypothetical protein [Mycoplasmatota bacterium]
MPTEITLINWTEGTVYQNDAPKRIKLRDTSYVEILKKVIEFGKKVEETKAKEAEPVTSAPEIQEEATEISSNEVSRLKPRSAKLSEQVDLLALEGKVLGKKVASKALKVKEKMRNNMIGNMQKAEPIAIEVAETTAVPAPIEEPIAAPVVEPVAAEKEMLRVNRNETSIAKIEKYSSKEQEQVEEKAEEEVRVTPVYEPAEPAIIAQSEEVEEDVVEPKVMPTEVEKKVEPESQPAISQEGFGTLKMEALDIDKLAMEVARRREESESIAAERMREEQATAEAEAALMRKKQELEDKYRAVEEQNRILTEQNQKEKAEIDALRRQREQINDSTQAYASSIEALNAMLTDTKPAEKSSVKGK